MLDTTLIPGRVQLQGGQNSYAGQDLESQAIGPAIPFSQSVEFGGSVILSFDTIFGDSSLTTYFDSQDMEALQIGVITVIPATIVGPSGISNPTASVTIPPVLLTTGILTPLLNVGDDDLESYPVGPIASLTQSFSSGDITMKAGNLRPFP